MKNFILVLSFLGLFAGCSPDTHVNSVTGKSGSDPVLPKPPKPDVKTCQHPDAANYTDICTDEKGSCIFYACKDSKYVEYEKYLTFKRYVENHGGEIYHDPNLCKTIKDPNAICQHPEAINFGANDFCNFKACPDQNFTQYEKYLDFKEYVSQKGGGEVIGDNALCTTSKKIPGCMESAATNFNSKADLENGSCNFDKCSIEGKEKFDSAFKVIFEAYLAKLADLNISYSGIANTAAICGPAIVKGCMNAKAFNYNQNANIDDKSCEFKACTTVGTPGYPIDQPIRDAQAAYKILYPSAKDLISDPARCQTSGGDKEGCTDSNASNFDSAATIDNKTCEFKACTTVGTPGYPIDQPIRDAQAAYKIKYPTAKDLTSDPTRCNTSGGDIKGCTEQLASNYNQSAVIEDKSCEFKACQTAGTEKYIPHASIRDAYAAYKAKYPDAKALMTADCGGILGCMESKATNYKPSATVDDKTCEFKACQTAGTEKYIPHSPIRDAHAAYKAKYSEAKALMSDDCGGKIGCMDSAATNYDPVATIESNKCNFSGCIENNKQGYSEELARRFQDYLKKIGGQGQYQGTFTSTCGGGIVSGCTNKFADNYDPKATKDDCSCNFSYCDKIDKPAPNKQEYDEYVKTCPNSVLKNTCEDDGGGLCEEFKNDEMAAKNKLVRELIYPADCNKAYFDSIVEFTDAEAESAFKSCEAFNNCKKLGIIDYTKLANELKALGLFSPEAATYLQHTCVKLKIESTGGTFPGASPRTPEESQQLFEKYCECKECGQEDGPDDGGSCKENDEAADENKNSGYTFNCEMLKEYNDNFHPGAEFEKKVQLCYETKGCFEKGKVDYSQWEEDLQILKDRAVAIGFVTSPGVSAFQYFYNIPNTQASAGWKSLCAPIVTAASGFPYNDSVVAAMYQKYCTCAECGPTTPPSTGESCDKLPASDKYLTNYNGYFYNCEFLKAIEDKYCDQSSPEACITITTSRKNCESRKYCAQRGLLSDAAAMTALQNQTVAKGKAFFYNIYGFEKYLNGQEDWVKTYDTFDSICVKLTAQIENCKSNSPQSFNNCNPASVLGGISSEAYSLYKDYCAPCEHECAKGKF